MNQIASFPLRAPAKANPLTFVTPTNGDTYPPAPEVTESDLFFLTANPFGGKEIQAYRPDAREWYPVFISDNEREVALTLNRLLTLPGAQEVKGCGFCRKPILGRTSWGKRGPYCSPTHLERVEKLHTRIELEVLFQGIWAGVLGFLLIVAVLSLLGVQ